MLRGEQAQHRALERVAVLEARDAVVRERGAHQREELLADAGAARAQAAHEHAQARVVRGAEVARDRRARRADQQLLDVGEGAQLAPDLGQLAAQLRRELVRQRRVEQRDEALDALLVHVVAEEDVQHLVAHGFERLAANVGRGGIGAREIGRAELAVRAGREERLERVGHLGEAQPARGGRSRRAVRARIDHQQHLAGGHLLPALREHLLDDARDGRGEADLHLHGFEHAERLADLDALARAHVDRHHHRRRSRAHLAGRLSREEVGVALDLEAQARLGGVVEQAQRAVAHAQARRVPALLAQAGRHHAAVEVHAVAPGAHRVDHQPVRLAAVAEIDLLSHRGRHARGRDVGRVGKEVQPRRLARGLIREDARGDQRLDREAGLGAPGGDEAVEPLGVDAPAPVVVGGQHVEQEALVGGAARDHEIEVRERAEQPRARLLARVAGRDHLRDQRIEGRAARRCRR